MGYSGATHGHGGIERNMSFIMLKPSIHIRNEAAVLMRMEADNATHVHWKETVEMILEMCSSYYDTSMSQKI